MVYSNESMEMYLENLLLLQEKKPQMHAVDLAEFTGYTKPSISRAMGLLRERGYLCVDGDGTLHLTDSGRALAEKILERHRLLTDFLVGIGVSPETAAKDACKIEHDISDETFSKMKEHAGKHTSRA